jgi:hypothetical protein
MDRQLHRERLIAGTRWRRIHPIDWSDLADGAFILADGRPALVRGRQVIEWTTAGYGYSVQIDPAAQPTSA